MFLAPDFLIVYYLIVVLFLHDAFNLYQKGRHKPWEGGFYYELRPDEALILQNALCLGASVLGAWVWFAGLDGAQPTKCMPKGALLGVFDIYDARWRNFAAAFAIIFALGYSFLLYFHARKYVGYYDFAKCQPEKVWKKAHLPKPGRRVKAQPCNFTWPTIWEFSQLLLRPPISWSTKRLRRLGKPGITRRHYICAAIVPTHFFMVNLGGPIIAIISVERTIQVNELQTSPISESTGQILVLILGITMLITALRQVISESLRASRGIEVHWRLDVLGAHAYYAPKCLSAYGTRLVLEHLLDDYVSHTYDSVVSGKQHKGDSLVSRLQRALVHQMARNLKMRSKDGIFDTLEKYRELEALDTQFSAPPAVEHQQVSTTPELAVRLVARDHNIEATKQLLRGDSKEEELREVCWPADGKSFSEVVRLPFPKSADKMERILDLISIIERRVRKEACVPGQGGQYSLQTCYMIHAYEEALKNAALDDDKPEGGPTSRSIADELERVGSEKKI
jgi:hypothetical protein